MSEEKRRWGEISVARRSFFDGACQVGRSLIKAHKPERKLRQGVRDAFRGNASLAVDGCPEMSGQLGSGL